jgi:Ca2+-binding EF-hand superfamily protein
MPGLKIGVVLVLAVALCGVAVPGSAGDYIEGKVDRIFEKLDANRDGGLSPDEVRDHWMEKKFDRADADGNGAVTRQELLEFKSGWHHKKAQVKSAQIIEKLDVDQDGRVSRQEAGNHWMAHKFERVDVDSDGFLTYEEILAFKSGCKHKHKKYGKHADKILVKLDADQDGVISVEEAREHWLGHKFEKVDADSDGFITLDELREFKKGWKHKKWK